jgi:hypothetical protein
MNSFVKPVTKRGLMAIAIAALATLLAPTAKASCGSAEAARKVLANKPWSVLRPALAQSAVEGAAPALEAEDGSEPSIAGLWKTVFVSGGSVATVGFDSWHNDGTEFAYDSAPVVTGTYCPGTWEKTGRTFSTVHPSYNYDPVTGNPNSVFIERVHITLSKDGKSFAGTFTWDCYDFSGNLQTSGPFACSLTGTLTGTRITVDGPFPFPFPL